MYMKNNDYRHYIGQKRLHYEKNGQCDKQNNLRVEKINIWQRKIASGMVIVIVPTSNNKERGIMPEIAK